MAEKDAHSLGVFANDSGFIALDAEWHIVYADAQPPQALPGASLWEQYPQLVNTPFYAQAQAVMQGRSPAALVDQGRQIHIHPTPGGLSIHWSPTLDTGPTARGVKNLDEARQTLQDLTAKSHAITSRAADITGHSRRITAAVYAQAVEAQRYQALLAGARRSLAQVESRFNLALSVINEAFWDYDLRNGEIWRSDSYARIFNLVAAPTPSTMEWWTERVHPDDRERVLNCFHSTLEGTASEWSCDYRIMAGDGAYRYVSDRAAILRDESGRAVRAAGAILDLTELRLKEEALRDLQSHRVEDIAQVEVQRKLLEQREMERIQIARDLHDGPLQALSGLAFSLQMIREMVEDENLQEMLQVIAKDVHAQAAELRAICNELRPPLLDQFGLAKSFLTLADDFRYRHAELQLDLTLPSEPIPTLPQPVEIALFRILQEALNNVARHASASSISAGLAFCPGCVTLTIRDNGVGIPTPVDWVALARHGHLGLVGMKERAEAISGALHVHSTPGDGATIQVVVPLG